MCTANQSACVYPPIALKLLLERIEPRRVRKRYRLAYSHRRNGTGDANTQRPLQYPIDMQIDSSPNAKNGHHVTALTPLEISNLLDSKESRNYSIVPTGCAVSKLEILAKK